MNDVARNAEVHVTPAQMDQIYALYDQGLYLQAFRRSEEIGPLKNWRGTEARLLAGRMAGNLGSPHLSDWHFIHAWRKEQRHPEAMWFFARYLSVARGPLATWKFLNQYPLPIEASKESKSHWYSCHAVVLGQLRDFDAAEDWLKKADELGPVPWTCLEWATLYSLEDRHDLAEAAARRALELHSWYRPAVQWVAHFLVQRERDDEAIQLLTEATQRLESCALFAQLAHLQIELELFAEASHSLDAFERHAPLMQNELQQWLESKRCDIACRQGQHEQAQEHAKKSSGKFYERLQQRLTHGTNSGKRVVLPVGYVRQHHHTCAPATLAALCRYWKMPGEHEELAEAISYAGTPHSMERKWSREHGWFTKEFTVTWDSAVALIERGIPFTITTTEVTSAHQQAIIGYDAVRGTLIVRDPNERHQSELPIEILQERYRSTGPHGMALLPMAERERLESLSLPDEALRDQSDRLEIALQNHQRQEADKIVQEMAEQQPGHFLTLLAWRTLASYDADLPAEMQWTEQLLQLFPGDLRLELHRAHCLRVMGRREERLELLKTLAEKQETDPACWQQYAQELSVDARQHPRALALLRRAIRCNPASARLYETLGRIRWDQRQFDEALQAYHFAVCLEDKDEYLVNNYFQAARAKGKTSQVLQLLEKRFTRFGAKSSHPARTLYGAYVQLERLEQAFAVLEKAMQLRPDDGDLLIYAAEARMYQGEFAKAGEILVMANGISRPASRLRSLASLALAQGDSLQARDYWRQVLEIEPIAEDAHRSYAQLLAEKEGRQAALQHLEALCQRFPHHFGLNRLLLDWTLEDGPQAREKLIKSLIEIHPADAWARREYALNLADQGLLEDGFVQLAEAARLEPHSPNLWSSRAYLCKKAGNIEDAKSAQREAIRLTVDFQLPIHELVAMCESLQERREALSFVEQELIRQVTFGDGLLAFRDAALSTLPPDELLASLQRALEYRSDLWHAWSAVIRQLVGMERGAEALQFAQKAVQRFPLLPAMWLDLAEAQRINKNHAGEIEALQRALQLSPAWNLALRQLADAHERSGNLEKAKAVLERAIARAPLVSYTYLDYAELLWRQGAHDQAILQVRHALHLDPSLELAWNRLGEWSMQMDRFEEIIALARSWTISRPGEARSWKRLGQALTRQGRLNSIDAEQKRLEECLSAYDEALRLNPFAKDLHDMKAEALALAGKYDEARIACNDPIWKGKPPLDLRARAAWVKSVEGNYSTAKEQICKILKEDPNYQWGWNQLADWCFTSSEFSEYLDAANEMLRLNPQSAHALTYRGEARLRMGQRETGMEDLRMAYRKDPCFAMAGFLLFDEQLIDNNLAGAEATLNLLQQNIGGPYVRARQLQMAAKRENPSIALETFKTLCLNKATPTPALDMAMRALDLANWKDAGEQILRESMKQEDWNTHLALLFAERWNPNIANDLPERIAALDRALEKQPESFRFLDLKAQLLGSGNQFQRAMQVCQSKTFPQDQFALEGRGIWVQYFSGKTTEAIYAMRDLVKQHPRYYWGWTQLADWYGRQQSWVDVLTIAEQLILLAPKDPLGFGHRGLAKEKLGDTAAARADYAHALDLSPAYVYAAWQLFNIHVRSSEWKKAEKILEKIKKQALPAEHALYTVDLLVYQNKKAQFPTEFEKLCRSCEKYPWLLDQSLAFLMQAGWWNDVEPVLHNCLDLAPHICDAWVRLHVATGNSTIRHVIQNMSKRRPERTNCIAAYAIELAYTKQLATLKEWIYEHEECLREDTPNWAKVGRALDVVQDWHGLVEWMSDWANHPTAKPTNLITLVRAYRSLNRIDSARKVSLHALTKLTADFASAFHKVWLVFDQALAGEVQPIQSYLEREDQGGFDGYHRMIVFMLRALWMTLSKPEEGFAGARRFLAESTAKIEPVIHDPALTQAYQNCIRVMAKTRNSWPARLWRWWRWYQPLLPQKPKQS